MPVRISPIFYILVIICVTSISAAVTGDSTAFIKGADVSFIPQIEDLGGFYMENGIPQDALKIMQDRGINYIRLKLWHSPAENYNNLNKILIMARRIKDRNLGFLLDFHYSDTWADPGHQTKPTAWKNIPFPVLKDSVEQYTKNVMTALYAQNTLPDMVQLGNEIVSGMLWNDGRVGGNFENTQQWQNLADLLRAGVAGVRTSCPQGDSVRILIHIDRGGDNTRCRWFYDRLIANNVPFDIIGLSYYPWWHGTLAQVKTNLNDLALRYNKDLFIAETAYPWTLQWFDTKSNIVGNSSQLLPGYPASVEGQAAFLKELMQIIRDVKNNKGAGLFYWAPEYISVQPIGSPWENVALFDFQGNALASMDVFKPPVVPQNPIQVVLRLNTCTLMDTLRPWQATQIRGEISGVSSDELPDGRRVSWDENSGLWLENEGGDYWQIRFPLYPGDELSYKFWSGFSATRPTFQRLGWEGPIIVSPERSENRRLFVAGQKDTVVQIQYYNSTGEAKLQYWLPFAHQNDSIAVYFRVNMAKAADAGRFDPENNHPVSVAGHCRHDFSIPLIREVFSVAGGSFWSGAAYFPKAEMHGGDTLSYTFNFNNGGDQESAKRTFVLRHQQGDTTLPWVYYDDGHSTSAAHDQTDLFQFRLEQNFPNPFNGYTRIHYTLSQSQWVSLKIYDLSAKLHAVLVHAAQPAGSYDVDWRPEKYSGSGVYLFRLQSGVYEITRKMLYIK